MTDLSRTIEPKSDQLNSDDLIAGSMTIRITKISANLSAPEQPISIFYEGDGGKPYKPCKSMRRVLVNTWGADGTKFTGRAMTLYRDPSVKFGGLEVGGIRISHMSDIEKPITIALTATRANRKPFTVNPLREQPSQNTKPAPDSSQSVRQDAGTTPKPTLPASAFSAIAEQGKPFAAQGMITYREWFQDVLTKEERHDLTNSGEHDRLKALAVKADDDSFPGDRP